MQASGVKGGEELSDKERKQGNFEEGEKRQRQQKIFFGQLFAFRFGRSKLRTWRQ